MTILWDESSNGPKITERNYSVALGIATDTLAGDEHISLETAKAVVRSVAKHCPYINTRDLARKHLVDADSGLESTG